MQTNLMQCAAYDLSTDRLTAHPFNLCSNAISQTSISQTQNVFQNVYFPNTTSVYDAEHEYSTSLVDHGDACSE